MHDEHLWSLEAVVAETRATVHHVADDVAVLRTELRTEVGRLDNRLFQMLLVQIATLAGTLVSVATAVLSIALR